MTSIDATARIERGAELGRDVTIGPFCVIGPKVILGDGCLLAGHVHVTGRTIIGGNQDSRRSPRWAPRRNRFITMARILGSRLAPTAMYVSM